MGGVGREMDIKLVKLQRQETGIPGGVEMKSRNQTCSGSAGNGEAFPC